MEEHGSRTPAPRVVGGRARIEAARWSGEVRPDTKLAGLSLLGRLLRQLARVGFDEAFIEIGERTPAEMGFVRSESPAGLSMTFRGADEVEGLEQGKRADVELRATALYETETLEQALRHSRQQERGAGVGRSAGEPRGVEAEPWLEPRDRQELAEASRRLWGRAGKSVAHDGLVAYYVGRPVGRLFSRVLVWTPVTPNQVTIVSMLVGVAGALLAARGGRWWLTGGAFLYWFGMVVDCVDGDLARVRIEGSRTGQWLDTVADDVSTAAMTLGFGLGLSQKGASELWAWGGVIGAVAVALSAAHVYRGLIRYGLPIDTATYPWFFLGEQGVVFEEESGSRWSFLAFAVRRDFSSAVYVICSAVGLAWLAFGFMVLGALVAVSLAVVDFIVKITTRREA